MADRPRKKILIRVIGAPLLLAALGLVLYGDAVRDSNAGLRLLLAGVGFLAALEFYGLCSAKGIPTARWAGALGAGAILFPWTWAAQKAGLAGIRADFAMMVCLAPTVLVLWVLLKLVFRHGRFPVEGAALTLAGFLYVGLLHFVVIVPMGVRPFWCYLLFLVAANKGSDMAAYAVGKAFGRHKMTPNLSPNKTWEGAAGGAVAGTAAGAAVLLATPLREAFAGVPAAALLFFSFLVTIAAQLGDLVESAFKRWAGVKDSGRLLPEFGGMLDMVDSFLVSVPVAHILTLVLIS